jgi:hypothetical protein
MASYDYIHPNAVHQANTHQDILHSAAELLSAKGLGDQAAEIEYWVVAQTQDCLLVGDGGDAVR